MSMLNKKNKWSALVQRGFSNLQPFGEQRIYPAPCHLCRQDTRDKAGLCTDCRHQWQIKLEQPHCAGCGVAVDEVGLCRRCYQGNRGVDQVIAACAWDEQTRHIVHRLKYHHDFSVIRLIVESLMARLQSGSTPAFEQLVAMPQHPQRRIERGFDQARLIAEQLGQQLALPVSGSVLQRVVHTPSLTGLNRQQRREVLTDAFALTAHSKRRVARHVALVDDVLTTGASAQAAAKRLYQAGADQVSVLVFARVPD